MEMRTIQNSNWLGLGTVQFGVPYGNMAKAPLMPREKVFAILDVARQAGIRFFDTAIGYGESEARLGAYDLAQKCPEAEISSKIPRAEPTIWQDETKYWPWVTNHLEASRTRLKIPRHGLLQFHQCDVEFLEHAAVQKSFQRLLDEKLCAAIGISVYTPEQAEAALQIPSVRALQVPVNLVDRRFFSREFQQKLRKNNTFLILRSVFMQGVLIDNAPLPQVKKTINLEGLRACAKAAVGALSLQEAVFRLLLGNHRDDFSVLLIGVDSPESLRQNLALFETCRDPLDNKVLQALTQAEVYAAENGLLNPALWDQ